MGGEHLGEIYVRSVILAHTVLNEHLNEQYYLFWSRFE